MSHRLRTVEAGARALLLSGALTAAGCITINIYFPAAAAEKAADRIIDDVLDTKGAAAPAPAPAK
jgi:hypothetical protein